jgi:hypothetical protein
MGDHVVRDQAVRLGVMLYALGFVPPTPLIEPDTMRRTLYDVLPDWEWDSTWGWDFPAIAMTAVDCWPRSP